MNIKIIAADSMGTRSMATYVETEDIKLFIDPAAALGPLRYSLPPHKKEEAKLKEHIGEIIKHAKKCNVLIITHYHYDHYNPDEFLEVFKDKTVYVKHPKENINKSQQQRSKHFLDKLQNLSKEIIYSDGQEAVFGNTKITFSPAVFHGTDSKLGYVTEVLIDDGKEKFLFTSDVEGLAVEEQAEFILKNCPDIILADGPMTYMLGYRYSYDNFNKSIANLLEIIAKCKSKYLILDHHLLRDLKWKERTKALYENAGKTKIVCAAEFMNLPLEMLEARRKELWGK